MVLASPSYFSIFNIFLIRKPRSAIRGEFSLNHIRGKITNIKKKDIPTLLKYVLWSSSPIKCYTIRLIMKNMFHCNVDEYNKEYNKEYFLQFCLCL